MRWCVTMLVLAFVGCAGLTPREQAERELVRIRQVKSAKAGEVWRFHQEKNEEAARIEKERFEAVSRFLEELRLSEAAEKEVAERLLVEKTKDVLAAQENAADAVRRAEADIVELCREAPGLEICKKLVAPVEPPVEEKESKPDESKDDTDDGSILPDEGAKTEFVEIQVVGHNPAGWFRRLSPMPQYWKLAANKAGVVVLYVDAKVMTNFGLLTGYSVGRCYRIGSWGMWEMNCHKPPPVSPPPRGSSGV